MRKLPAPRSGAYKLLQALVAGPGTFYQICERAEIDIEADADEQVQRGLVDQLIDGGHVHQVGHVYDITTPARAAIAPQARFVGQVAGPAYRGTPHPMPVTIARRAAGARA